MKPLLYLLLFSSSIQLCLYTSSSSTLQIEELAIISLASPHCIIYPRKAFTKFFTTFFLSPLSFYFLWESSSLFFLSSIFSLVSDWQNESFCFFFFSVVGSFRYCFWVSEQSSHWEMQGGEYWRGKILKAWITSNL